MLQTFFVHNQHYQVDPFCADLQPPASTAHGNERGSAPAVCCAATGHATPMFAANDEAALDQVRNYHNAFRAVEYFLRDTFIWRIQDFLKHVARLLQTLSSILLGRKRPTHAAKDGNHTQQECKQRSSQSVLLESASGRFSFTAADYMLARFLLRNTLLKRWPAPAEQIDYQHHNGND